MKAVDCFWVVHWKIGHVNVGPWTPPAHKAAVSLFVNWGMAILSALDIFLLDFRVRKGQVWHWMMSVQVVPWMIEQGRQKAI